MSITTAKTNTRFSASALRDSTPWTVRFQRLLDDMTDGEKRVGSYFMEHPDAAQKSIGELIDVSGLGYGTVIRFCQKLGCRGFQEFKVLMARDALAAQPDRSTGGTGAYEAIVQRLNEDVMRTAQNLDSREIERAAEALCKATRVLCVGVASSAPLALSLDWKIKRFGIVSSCISDGYVMAVEASLLRKDSVLVAVSSSGATKDIVTAARLAREGGATVIAVTNFTKAPLIEAANIRLITSAVRDPLIAEVPSIVAGEAVFEILIDQIRRVNPNVDQTVLETFQAIADRKM
jgi:DNA-binding MurR/RpiR family transcriptional regulator